jgi:hypothetical protein
MLETDKPLLISDQTILWLWVNGEDTEQFDGIMRAPVNNKLFTMI